jgi:hypothetical protein
LARRPCRNPLACCCALFAVALAHPAAAAEEPVATAKVARAGTAEDAISAGTGTYVHTFGGVGIGRGLRLNNPFRLRTELGESSDSLSLTATYALIHVGAALGEPDGVQHGIDLRLSAALDGISQQVLAPSYIALYAFPKRLLVYGRLGAPVILAPDLNVGGEAALGGAGFVTGGIAIGGELAYSVFYGAGTWETAATVVPLVSIEVGVWFDLELLP